MKRWLGVFLVLFISLLACSAQHRYKGLIEISAGPSFPYGDFGSTLLLNPESGFAQTGLFTGLAFNYRMQAHLGLVAMVSRMVSPVDEVEAVDKYYMWPGGFTVESEAWISNAYLAGLDIILPIYRSDFYFRILGGMASIRLPAVTGSNFNLQVEASKDLAAAWSIGSGLTYQAFRKVTLSLRMNMFLTRPYLEEAWTSDLQSGSRKISPSIQIFHVTAGLGFWIF